MKIKVDKEEYERLLKRVEELEKYRAEEWERFGGLVNNLQRRMEDFKEPKEFWYIGQDGVIFSDTDTITQDYADRLKAIGNYFETKKEAKEAVDKLKAWKILRENKVHFDFATLSDEDTITIFARKKGAIHEYDKELFLLFGKGI